MVPIEVETTTSHQMDKEGTAWLIEPSMTLAEKIGVTSGKVLHRRDQPINRVLIVNLTKTEVHTHRNSTR